MLPDPCPRRRVNSSSQEWSAWGVTGDSAISPGWHRRPEREVRVLLEAIS